MERAHELTLVVYSLDIPSGRLRNASLASSFNNPKGAVRVCGSLANIAYRDRRDVIHKGLKSQDRKSWVN